MDTEKNLIRIFKFEDKEFKLFKPNAKAAREAKLAYTKAWTNSIKDGLFLKADLQKKLNTQNNSFIIEHENKKSDLIQKIAILQQKLKESGNLSTDELEKTAQMLSIYRSDLLSTDQIVNEIFSNTAEQIAEEEKLLVLLARCIKDIDNNYVWNSVDEILEEENLDLVETCKYQLLCFEYNLDPEWNTQLPEYIAMQQVQDIKTKEEEDKTKEEEAEADKTKEIKEEVKVEPKSKTKSTTQRSKKTRKSVKKKEETTIPVEN